MLLYLLTLGLDDDEKEQITNIYFEYGDLMKAVAFRYFNDINTVKDIHTGSIF